MRPFPPEIIKAAQQAELRFGIPASSQLAQWVFESNWGEDLTGKNNCWGIKARCDKQGNPIEPSSLCWTHEYVAGRRIRCQQPFADYPTLQASFEAHADLIANRTGKNGVLIYGQAMQVLRRGGLPAKPLTVEAFVHELAKKYATDPNYAQTLTGFMRQRNLYQYDQYALKGGH